MGVVITAVLPVLIDLLKNAPAEIEGVKTAWNLLTSHTPATPDQQAQIDAALDEANDALQKS